MKECGKSRVIWEQRTELLRLVPKCPRTWKSQASKMPPSNIIGGLQSGELFILPHW